MTSTYIQYRQQIDHLFRANGECLKPLQTVQTRQKFKPDLDPNCLKLLWYPDILLFSVNSLLHVQAKLAYGAPCICLVFGRTLHQLFKMAVLAKSQCKLMVKCVHCPNQLHAVKPVYNGHSQKDGKLVFNTNYRLMQVKSIAECSPWSILQYL